jgi:hypothetical protein
VDAILALQAANCHLLGRLFTNIIKFSTVLYSFLYFSTTVWRFLQILTETYSSYTFPIRRLYLFSYGTKLWVPGSWTCTEVLAAMSLLSAFTFQRGHLKSQTSVKNKICILQAPLCDHPLYNIIGVTKQMILVLHNLNELTSD